MNNRYGLVLDLLVMTSEADRRKHLRVIQYFLENFKNTPNPLLGGMEDVFQMFRDNFFGDKLFGF